MIKLKSLHQIEKMRAAGRIVAETFEVLRPVIVPGITTQELDKIAAEHILRTREKLNKILAENTGKPIEQIALDTERDNWLSAQEAMDYGIVDKVFYKR